MARNQAIDQAKTRAGSAALNLQMPELTLDDVTKNAEILLRFSKEMKFPDEILKLAKSNN